MANRYEVMLKLQTRYTTTDVDQILSDLRDEMEIVDADNNITSPEEATLYDVDVYSAHQDGEVILKVLIDSELTQSEFVESVFYQFDTHLVTSSSFEQCRPTE